MGAFGVVVASRHIELGQLVAIKKIEKAEVRKRNLMTEVEEEGKVLRMLAGHPSPFCLFLLYAFSDDNNFYFAMPIATAGDLDFHIVKTANGLSIERARFYLGELALAISHLHSLGIIYRDLKPANVLLDHAGHVLLSDFGLARHIGAGGELQGKAGTEGFWSPEVITSSSSTPEEERTAYGFASDWWSLGATLFYFLEGTGPFSTRITKLESRHVFACARSSCCTFARQF